MSRPSEATAPGAAAQLERCLATLRPTRALVDLDAIAANFVYLSERAAGAHVLCVVKADAYGHGAVPVAAALAREGARWFGVALVEEGIELREAGVAGSILLLGGCEDAQLETAVDADLTPTIISRESFDALCRLAARRGVVLRCHLKVDTGMTRLGIPWQELDDLAARLPDCGLEIEGLYTHLATSDDPAVAFTRDQLERFHACRDALLAQGLPRPMLHVASSAGLLTRAEADVQLVRPGLALYGLNPFGNARAPELTPAMTLVSRVIRVASFPRGTSVGYGCTFIAHRDSRFATIPVGYEDGLPRALSGDWEVVIRGCLVPLVGRVSMDLVVADVTDLEETATGDAVIVAGGGDGSGAHPIEEMARRLRTIPYEVTTGISSRVPRVFLRDGAPVEVASRYVHASLPAPEGA
jgi:alanine racemase